MKIRLALIALYLLLLIGLVYTAFRYLTCVVGNTKKAWNIALMIDETCNVDANGKVNESISKRAALAQQRGTKWGCVLCKLLDSIQTNHCENTLHD